MRTVQQKQTRAATPAPPTNARGTDALADPLARDALSDPLDSDSVQMKADGPVQLSEEEEEDVQAKTDGSVQLAEEEEEEVQAKTDGSVQLSEEEEELQMKDDTLQLDIGSATVPEIADAGMQGSGSSLPFADTIQSAFGAHDISGTTAHTDARAAAANKRMGAKAYAKGDDISFKGSPDLHTAAHEAAHTVQQKNGLSLPGKVGKSGDSHEKHADSVADAVVAGKSAEPLLDRYGKKSKAQA